MNLRSIFLNESNILRSGWRFFVFIVFFTALTTVMELTMPALGVNLGPDTPLSIALNSVIFGIIALGLSWACLRFVENLPFNTLGISFSGPWLRQLLIGLGIGAATYMTATLIAVVGGGIRFSHNSETSLSGILTSMAISFLILSVAAAFEEIFFRGYILQTFARSGYAWPAIILTSAFFGIAHGSNPNVTFIAVLNTVLAGIWFGSAWLRTQSLWFPIGLHFAWNWVQGNIFGVEISGLTTIITAPVLTEIDHGPVWLTGGAYGIEGGIGCTMALVVAIAGGGLLRVDGRR